MHFQLSVHLLSLLVIGLTRADFYIVITREFLIIQRFINNILRIHSIIRDILIIQGYINYVHKDDRHSYWCDFFYVNHKRLQTIQQIIRAYQDKVQPSLIFVSGNQLTYQLQNKLRSVRVRLIFFGRFVSTPNSRITIRLFKK